MTVKRAKPSGARDASPASALAVTAAELAAARDRLVQAHAHALDVAARALDECPRHPGGTTDVLAATEALGPERAGLARDLLHRLGLIPAPLAETG